MVLVFLYTEGVKAIKKSGLGKAIEHQKRACELNNINFTKNKNDNWDILHINTYFLKSYFIAKKARKQGKKVVYHAHSTEEDYKDGFILAKQTSKLFKWWLVKCYKLGNVLITPTDYSKKLISSYKGLENTKIYDVSNGIELDFFQRNEKMGQEFRNKYNIKENEKVIIGIGLYIERKGIVDFVELAKRMKNYKFIWFGSSPLLFSTRKVKKAVRTKLDNLIFAGYVDRNEIKSALSGCDLFIFPTLEETEGMPIVEACACKTKSIVRDIPVFDPWLKDGVNVYKAKDVDEFEDKIKMILDGKLEDLTEAAYKVAEERDLKSIGEKLKNIYESL